VFDALGRDEIEGFIDLSAANTVVRTRRAHGLLDHAGKKTTPTSDAVLET